MRLAKQTMQLIDDAIFEDQGALFRQAEEVLLPKMEDAYRGQEDDHRSHLGISQIGRDCGFELWLGFRWAKISKFPARILRLFNRGHLEEARFIAMLVAAGIEIWYETKDGGQYRISDFGGHFGSALDGIVKIPELDNVPAYAEFKTHNDKSFKKLVKEGVRSSKPEHYVQMQLCMHYYKLKYGVYFSVNKNDDSLHIEIIDYDHNTVTRYQKRAEHMIFTEHAPVRISDNESWWQCKYCSKLGICHRKEKPAINCRTCSYITARRDGSWICTKHDKTLDKATMQKKFKCHMYHPALIPSVQLMDAGSEDNNTHYLVLKLESGKIIKHGPNHITSKELDLNQ